MTFRGSPTPALAVIAACLLSACAGTPSGDAERRAADVKVYEMDQPFPGSYEIVGRPWVDSRQAALSLSTHPTRDAAIASLREEAARRGANGLVNVGCLDQARTAGPSGGGPAFLCYGIAVRLRSGEG